MLAKTNSLLAMNMTSMCKQCSSVQKLRYLNFSNSPSRFQVSPTVEQIALKSQAKLNRNRTANNVGVEQIVHQSKSAVQDNSIDFEDFNERRLRFRRVVEKAEDVLGYRLHRLNNSFLRGSLTPSPKHHSGITSLFEDEAKVILSSIKKLEGSNHPLLSYAKAMSPSYTEDSDVLTSSIQLRSMVVLLVAKSFGFSSKLQAEADEKSIETAQSKQRALAEITELIYTAHMIHRTVVEIPKGQLLVLGEVAKDSSSEDSEPKSKGASLHHGNKIATLMGDLLLARSSKGLASLRNSNVTEVMSDSIADFTESEMVVSVARGSLGVQGSTGLTNSEVACNSKPRDVSHTLNYDTWLRRSNLSIGSLLGHSCFSSLIFGGHDQETSKLASAIGCKIGLAVQAFKDYSVFESNGSSDVHPYQFDLCSLPVIFHLEQNPHLLSKALDNYQMHEEVKTSPFAMVRTKETLLVLLDDAHSLLSKLPTSSPSSKVLNEFLSSLS